MPGLMDLFGRSPLVGLQKHMKVVAACSEHMPALIEALCSDDKEALEAEAKLIFELENQADLVKNEMRSHLPSSMFMPVDRRDLLEILHAQDSIADTAQDIAGLCMERDMRLPEEFHEPLKALTVSCVGVVRDCHTIVERLDELLEVGFRGRQVDEVVVLLDALNLAEDKTDELGIALTRLLFAREKELDPVTVILWYRVIEWIGDLADHAEKVGNRLRLLIAI
jgi:predicted phosphate transport protein (TIGR00153 family)